MKSEEHLQVAVDRKASCKTWCFPAHRDSSDMYCNKFVVQDPIQKYNYRPEYTYRFYWLYFNEMNHELNS